VRTTIRLDERLLRQAKEYAIRHGQTLTGVIDDALRQFLARRPARSRGRFDFPTFRGKGLRPGVDLDDSAGLLDLMESSR
jgi:hypothetical protein